VRPDCAPRPDLILLEALRYNIYFRDDERETRQERSLVRGIRDIGSERSAGKLEG
jgi:hypothetical protein